MTSSARQLPSEVVQHLSNQGIITLADPGAKPWPWEHVGTVSGDLVPGKPGDFGFPCHRHRKPYAIVNGRHPVVVLRFHEIELSTNLGMSLWVGQCPDCGRIYWADREADGPEIERIGAEIVEEATRRVADSMTEGLGRADAK